MASVIDSIRTVYTDNYSLVKLGVFGYLVFIIYSFVSSKPEMQVMNYLWFVLIVFFYVGYFSVIMHNRITQNLAVLPMINPVIFLSICVKGLAVMLPYLIVGLPLVNLVVGLFNFDGIPQQIAIGIIQLIVVFVALTALIYFSCEYNVKDGYDFAKIFSSFQDVLVYALVCVIALLFVNIFIAVPVLYLAYSFFDLGGVFKYAVCYLVTMNLAFLADYCGQLWFDLDSRNNYY